MTGFYLQLTGFDIRKEEEKVLRYEEELVFWSRSYPDMILLIQILITIRVCRRFCQKTVGVWSPNLIFP